MEQYSFFLASSLEKVFPYDMPTAAMGHPVVQHCFAGTKVSLQLVYSAAADKSSAASEKKFKITIDGWPYRCSLRDVALIASDYPCYLSADDGYISKKPGLFPDLLTPSDNGIISPVFNQQKSMWLTFYAPDDAIPKDYPVTIHIQSLSDEALHFTQDLTLRIPKTRLSQQSLLHTEWFHSDCLASFYRCPIFSEEYWLAVENFVKTAVDECAVNMLLTPVFTPPLDTEIGGERPTVQLVDIQQKGECFVFSFEKLRRWLSICQKTGIIYLEISHFFTQWGAKHLPKVIVRDEQGNETKMFGWRSDARDKRYKVLLSLLVPEMEKVCAEYGYTKDKIYYHISDEPSLSNLENYKAALSQVENTLCERNVIDALSNLEFYHLGLVKEPVCANDHIHPFLDAKVRDLWVYYCCAQSKQVPNRFFSMPSYRNRIMGVLMYFYHIKGFLHWGYNFYYSQYSKSKINPFYQTHANYAFPSGDAFLVYPGENFNALSSIRAEVLYDAFLDVRALQTLEQKKGRSFVEALIQKQLGENSLSFSSYPQNADFLLRLREATIQELEK